MNMNVSGRCTRRKNVKSLLLPWCFGQTRHSSPISEMHHYGQYIYIWVIKQNTWGASHQQLQRITLRISQRYGPLLSVVLRLIWLDQLSDKIQDFCNNRFGKPATSYVLSHLRRELIHEVWKILLDEEFTKAYADGFDVEFADGKVRRVFPRIFTYSADYPEKYVFVCVIWWLKVTTLIYRVLLASIKQLGKYPCPTCLVSKQDIHRLGTKRDARTRTCHKRADHDVYRSKIKFARNIIYLNGGLLNGKWLDGLLNKESLVPTQVRETMSDLEQC